MGSRRIAMRSSSREFMSVEGSGLGGGVIKTRTCGIFVRSS
jgi:hypothetical protein